jgi:hypothetical protein
VVTEFGRCDPVDKDGRPLRTVPPPLTAFDFIVEPGRATSLRDFSIRRNGVRVDLLYMDRTLRERVGFAPPSATGATYWVDGGLRDEGTSSPLPVSFGRIQDTVSRYDLRESHYSLVLGYGPGGGLSQDARGVWQSPYPLQNVQLTPISFALRDDEVEVVRADLTQALGEIEGRVTVSGADPGPGLALCVASTDMPRRYAVWCLDLAADGQFDLLLPVGPGHGTVCNMNVVTEFGRCDPVDKDGRPLRTVPPPLTAFDFTVEPGRATGVTFR